MHPNLPNNLLELSTRSVIAHNTLSLPPKFCLSIVFNFSWDDCMSQEKLKTMLMQKFGGKESVLWAIRK